MTSEPVAPPRLRVPAGAIDCHMHFYGERDRYPEAPTSKFLPPPATVADYRKVMSRLGISGTVVVQPSSYGTDNRCTIDAVAELGPDTARAVVVVDHTVADVELERLTNAGACGIRFLFPGGPLPWEIVETMAARVAAFGWHVQLQFGGGHLPERAPMMRRLPTNIVIPHIARLDSETIDGTAFRTLLDLIDTGRVWVKLSAPYEGSKDGPPAYADVSRHARALVAAAPERMVWASNWPHPHPTRPAPDEVDMLDLLLDWCPDDAVRRSILVDNPRRLYGFPPISAG